jgi:hypothetical protein
MSSFTRREAFGPLYKNLTRTVIHTVKPEQEATFLSRQLNGQTMQKINGDFKTHIQGTRIKHFMGPTSTILYGKFGVLARVECTTNDVTFFKHYRMVEQRDGTSTDKVAPAKKSIYSLPVLTRLMDGACRKFVPWSGQKGIYRRNKTVFPKKKGN